MRTRGATALLLALALTAAVPAAQKTAVTTGTGLPDAPAAEVEITWDDAWFAEDAAAYRHELALAAMALSGAAYAGTEEQPASAAALEQLGFEEVRSFHRHSADAAAYTFGVKRLALPEGGTALLTAIVIRGTGETVEWAGNLNLGPGGGHQGFTAARDELLKHLEAYRSGLPAAENTKFLVTGHSRGGAVANLTAAHLMDAGLAAGEDVYAYTFASPAVSDEAAGEGYENIFNIVNGEDLVPCLPLAKWGYARYGTDLLLPARSSDGYQEVFAKMEGRYRDLTGQPYAVYQDPAAVQKAVSAVERLIPAVSPGDMELLSALLGGDWEKFSALAGQNGTLLMGRKALALSATLAPLLRREREAVVSAHCMAGYFCWLSVCEPTAAGQ